VSLSLSASLNPHTFLLLSVIRADQRSKRSSPSDHNPHQTYLPRESSIVHSVQFHVRIIRHYYLQTIYLCMRGNLYDYDCSDFCVVPGQHWSWNMACRPEQGKGNDTQRTSKQYTKIKLTTESRISFKDETIDWQEGYSNQLLLLFLGRKKERNSCIKNTRRDRRDMIDVLLRCCCDCCSCRISSGSLDWHSCFSWKENGDGIPSSTWHEKKGKQGLRMSGTNNRCRCITEKGMIQRFINATQEATLVLV